MIWILRSHLRNYVCRIFILSVCSAGVVSFAQTACYSTPFAAVESLRTASSAVPISEGGRYRVMGVRADPFVMQRWAMVVNCDHPEWPILALQTGGSDVAAPLEGNQMLTASTRSIPVVHVGDIIRLWKQEDFLRIEVAAVSEESGGLGERIRVRLLPRNREGQWMPEQFFGVVRGPLNVEMQP